ncbi:hypothetical protein [Paracoccus marinaquae]|uniref:Uncharacterized protein n=1 Tax=Paracoccus marinaquae TaxID=2841926 RepID=A0ABS6AGQ0_9RHOB|nr:hypothetical protein [Paracoccus marinaquae]MBU3029758.1 hypothetical protein [Paracoccus marinaquae]
MPQNSKREARIARKSQARLAALEKSARLVAVVAEEISEKQPRASENPASIFTLPVRWSCDDPDTEGAWTWGVARQWAQEEWDAQIAPRLMEFSQLTWAEIDTFSSDSGHKMHHNMDIESICDEAQLRLIEIEKYQDTIFRFRLGNLQRLWGFRILDEFTVIWYDPTHKIYPVG